MKKLLLVWILLISGDCCFAQTNDFSRRLYLNALKHFAFQIDSLNAFAHLAAQEDNLPNDPVGSPLPEPIYLSIEDLEKQDVPDEIEGHKFVLLNDEQRKFLLSKKQKIPVVKFSVIQLTNLMEAEIFIEFQTVDTRGENLFFGKKKPNMVLSTLLINMIAEESCGITSILL